MYATSSSAASRFAAPDCASSVPSSTPTRMESNDPPPRPDLDHNPIAAASNQHISQAQIEQFERQLAQRRIVQEQIALIDAQLNSQVPANQTSPKHSGPSGLGRSILEHSTALVAYPLIAVAYPATLCCCCNCCNSYDGIQTMVNIMENKKNAQGSHLEEDTAELPCLLNCMSSCIHVPLLSGIGFLSSAAYFATGCCFLNLCCTQDPCWDPSDS